VRRVVLVAVALSAACSVRPPPPPPPAVPAGATLVELGGERFVFADRYHGQIVVLDFWAGWCAECRDAVPQVARVATAFASDGVIVLGVNVGESPDDATRAARELRIDYPIAFDPELAFSGLLRATSLPQVMVIDRDGSIAARSPRLDANVLATIRRLVTTPATASD
jgi:thiol-disulfide isomerase/thioredoxin